MVADTAGQRLTQTADVHRSVDLQETWIHNNIHCLRPPKVDQIHACLFRVVRWDDTAVLPSDSRSLLTFASIHHQSSTGVLTPTAQKNGCACFLAV